MNTTIAHQLAHRTIRAWKDQPISQEVREQLYAVASRTATAIGMQHCSIIRVTDPQIRAELSRIGKQKYVEHVPELWVFIVDCARTDAILRERGISGVGPSSMDAFTEGFTDACLMAQNVVNAAESLGIGTNYYGCLLNDPAAVVEALKLPRLTFPVLGLGMGYPDQDPQLKPRMPFALRFSHNTYEAPESWSESLRGYDAELQTYYDLRDPSRTVASFTDQAVSKLTGVDPKRAGLVNVIRAQGFDLALE